MKLSGEMNDLVLACRNSISSENGTKETAEIISRTQRMLGELGLVGNPAAQLLDRSVELGALGGKISGAGQGGAFLVVAMPGEGPGLADRLRSEGVSVLAEVSAKGAS
jgi:mevalonate kinase